LYIHHESSPRDDRTAADSHPMEPQTEHMIARVVALVRRYRQGRLAPLLSDTAIPELPGPSHAEAGAFVWAGRCLSGVIAKSGAIPRVLPHPVPSRPAPCPRHHGATLHCHFLWSGTASPGRARLRGYRRLHRTPFLDRPAIVAPCTAFPAAFRYCRAVQLSPTAALLVPAL